MDKIIALLIYIFETMKFVVISYYIIGLKSSNGKKKYLMIPIWLLLGIGTYIQGSLSLLNNLLLITMIVTILFSEGRRLSILSIIIEWFTVSFIDLMMWLVLVAVTPLGEQYRANEQYIDVLADVVGILPLLIIGYIMRKKNVVLRERLKDINVVKYLLVILAIIAMCVVCACMQGMVLGEITYGTKRLVMITSIVLSFFVVTLCVLYINVESSRKQLTEINALNEKCIEDQKNYYLNVMKKDEELRAFKHDVNKHMTELKVLVEKKEYDEIEKYLNGLKSYSKTDTIYKTGNLISDYIINAKIQEIREDGPLDVKIIGKFPQNIILGNTEICVIFANILDNAKEAILEYAGKRRLEMEIRNYRDRLYITIKNSSPKRDYEEGISTKKDKENHGYGMKNVHRILEKYDGTIETEWKDCMFITKIEV